MGDFVPLLIDPLYRVRMASSRLCRDKEGCLNRIFPSPHIRFLRNVLISHLFSEDQEQPFQNPPNPPLQKGGKGGFPLVMVLKSGWMISVTSQKSPTPYGLGLVAFK